jgi:glutamyl-Q tRNA(Asp) synthetase
MVAAVGSYLDAKAHGGTWAVRIDDLDPPRVVPGAADSILRCLEQFGLHWDGEIIYQSKRTEAYQAALQQLRFSGLVYACSCSRKEIGEALAGGTAYPGTCRHGIASGRQVRAWRIRTGPTEIAFQDLLQGRISQNLERAIGDFVLYRADHVFAYHLACAVDDYAQGVTHVVRGADLMESTPRQIFLQRLLGLPTPYYLHLPVALNAAGEKLSKQTLAAAISAARVVDVLADVLGFLQHPPPSEVCAEGALALLHWGIEHWDRKRLPAIAGARYAGT